MTSALGAGYLVSYGKWRMILLSNLLIVIGISICLIDNVYAIAFGRFIWGMAAGAFTVFCPKYVSEATPVELKGPLGAFLQLMCTFGIVIPAAMGLQIPEDLKTNPEYEDQFIVTNYWRVVWAVPFAFVLI